MSSPAPELVQAAGAVRSEPGASRAAFVALAGRARERLLPLVVPVALLAAWHVASTLELVSPQVLVPPRETARTLADMLASGELVTSLLVSLVRVGLGFGWGAVAGLVLGATLARSRLVSAWAEPLFHLLRQVPLVGWLPLLLLWLGIDELFKVAFIGLGALIPMTLKTCEGLRGVPEPYVEVARVLRLGWWRTQTAVVVPAALPALITGTRLSLGEAWKLVIGAELVAASEGIGYSMTLARTLFQLDVVLVGLLVIGGTGFVMDRLLLAVEARLFRWRRAGAHP